MRILVVSALWPAYNNSGLANASYLHALALKSSGHHVAILGSSRSISKHNDLFTTYSADCAGSGALYSPIRCNKLQILNVVESFQPEWIFLEGWQTGLTESFLRIALKPEVRLVMVSHGISIFPHALNFREIIRSICWLPYSIYAFIPNIFSIDILVSVLPKFIMIRRTIDLLARNFFRKKIFYIPNAPFNVAPKVQEFTERPIDILVIGYFSPIKNQIYALKLLSELPTDITMVFLGKDNKSYFRKCRRMVQRLQLEDRVTFIAPEETTATNLLMKSKILLNCSITEYFPLTILEAMASGTPFVSLGQGFVSSLNGGLTCKSFSETVNSIHSLLNNEPLWNLYSKKGFAEYIEKYSFEKMVANFDGLIINE